MNNFYKKTAVCAAILMLLAAGAARMPASEQAQIVTGTATGAQSVRLALPEFPFRSTEGQGADLTAIFNETVWNDLDFSGVVNLLPRSFYPIGRFGQPADVDAAAWTGAGLEAQFLAFGNASIQADRFIVETHLWDLQTRVQDREAFGLRFIGQPTPASVRLVAHQFADRIIRQLFAGMRGIAQTKIAFVSSRTGQKEIFVMDYDGENQYQLTTVRDLALTPSWSPDGERIAYTSYRRGVPDVAIISPLDRRGFAFPELEGTTTTPSWSPDGSRLAFASSHERARGQPDMEIFVSDARGGGMRRLTNSPGVDISPVWNPRTGREIAFVSDRSGTPQIYIADVEGGNLRRVVNDGGAAVNPAWSPDGRTIAFAWQRRGTGYDIFIHDIATGRNVQLTQGSRDNERPTWSPDGRHIAFESNRDGTRQIHAMLADGTKVRRLTSQGNNEGPSWSSYMGQQ